MSATIGVCARLALWNLPWLAAPIGMSVALLMMQLARATFPPAGATALLATYSLPLNGGATFVYVGAVALSATSQILVALLWNNLHPRRRYPTYWW